MEIYNKDRLKVAIESKNLDCVVASTRENFQYLTGFCAVSKMLKPYMYNCFAVITKHDLNIVHIVHFLGELDQVLDAKANIGNIFSYGMFFREHNLKIGKKLNRDERFLQKIMLRNNYQDSKDALIQLLYYIGMKYSNIGTDIQDLELIRKINNNTDINFIYDPDIFYFARQKKTESEIKILTESARCNEHAVNTVISKLYIGICESEIVSLFNQEVVKNGGIPEITMIKIGRNAIFGQCAPRKDNILKHGDILWFDSNIRYQGYWSDIARIYIIGENERAATIYLNLRKGMLYGRDNISIGMTGEEIFQLVMNYINENGFKEYRRHHVGHGIGLESYENPVLSNGNKYCVEEQSIISLETPYYEFGFGAVHLEDPLLIGKDKNKFLTLKPIPENIILRL
ncbi:MAG: aminopeptidase P family protein [Rickettsiales bacterium]|nr:aminopeptidase P family protein [Rickettsiales bacterium]